MLIHLCTGGCAGHGGIGQQRRNGPQGTLAAHRDRGGLRQSKPRCRGGDPAGGKLLGAAHQNALTGAKSVPGRAKPCPHFFSGWDGAIAGKHICAGK